MPTPRKSRPVQPRTGQLIETQNQILEYLRQDVEEWKKAGDRYDRTQRATIQALAALQQSNERQAEFFKDATKALATMLLEIQAITARTLELTRDIHTRGSNGGSTRH